MKNTSTAPIAIVVILLLLTLALAGGGFALYAMKRQRIVQDMAERALTEAMKERQRAESLARSIEGAEKVEHVYQKTAEALAAENELLKEQIEKQEQLIEALQARNKEMMEALGRGTIGEPSERDL